MDNNEEVKFDSGKIQFRGKISPGRFFGHRLLDYVKYPKKALYDLKPRVTGYLKIDDDPSFPDENYVEVLKKHESIPHYFGPGKDEIKVMDFENNEIQRIPEKFPLPKNLQFLSFRRNEDFRLPDNPENLGNLIGLDISLTETEELPLGVFKLPKLKHLFASAVVNHYGNECQYGTRAWERSQRALEETTKRKLEDREAEYVDWREPYKNLPENMGDLKNIETLVLGGNYLKSLPESLCELSKLKVLILDGNELESLPENFRKLNKLEVLSLERNKLKKLPDSFPELLNLKVLDLSGYTPGMECPLESLPEDFGKLKNLEALSLRHCNKLKTLPKSFGELTSLKDLDLYGAVALEKLPENFAKLDLERLDIPESLLAKASRFIFKLNDKNSYFLLDESEARRFEDDQYRFTGYGHLPRKFSVKSDELYLTWLKSNCRGPEFDGNDVKVLKEYVNPFGEIFQDEASEKYKTARYLLNCFNSPYEYKTSMDFLKILKNRGFGMKEETSEIYEKVRKAAEDARSEWNKNLEADLMETKINIGQYGRREKELQELISKNSGMQI